MDGSETQRVSLLLERVNSLSEELVQCQADKEFVWCLWKQLQVCSPDLTQAVGLIVDRERRRAELKDRGVLEVLQAKDVRIQQLEQEVRKQESEERGERALQECRQQLEDERSELQRRWEQETSAQKVEMMQIRQEVQEAEKAAAALSHQLSTAQQEVADKEQHLCQLQRQLQELRCLYSQSVHHAGEQAQIIQQLESLNLNTQKVLHRQEEAQAAERVSHQQLYGELSVSHQALCQRETALSLRLQHSDQHVQELQAQLGSNGAAAGRREMQETWDLRKDQNHKAITDTLKKPEDPQHLDLTEQNLSLNTDAEIKTGRAQKKTCVCGDRKLLLLQQTPMERQVTRLRTVPKRPRRRTDGPAEDEWEDLIEDRVSEGITHTHRPAHNNRVRNQKLLRQSQAGTHSCGHAHHRGLPEQKWQRRRLRLLQAEVFALQTEKRAARQHTEQLQRTHLQTETHRDKILQQLHVSKHLAQKQAGEVARLHQELQHCRQSHSTDGHLAAERHALQEQIRQLTLRLKNSSTEMNKHSSETKSLRSALHNSEKTLVEMRERVCVLERDVNMKRQILEDQRARLKECQDAETSRRGASEEMEKRVKCVSEESRRRKVQLDSLRAELKVAAAERQQQEQSSREQHQQQEERVRVLRARLEQRDQSVSELQAAAGESAHALEELRRRHALAHSQQQQLRRFVQALLEEVLRDVQATRARLRNRKWVHRAEEKSLIKAASILNLSQTELQDLMESSSATEQVCVPDDTWIHNTQHILQQQVLSVAELMDAVLVKMKEGKVLTEELAAVTAVVSTNS